MQMHHAGPCGLVVAACLLAACAANRPALDALPGSEGRPAALELRETPFFPQQAYQCGPAALATVLVASGVDVTPGELTGKVYLPERAGSLQLELVAASRRYARLPYPLDPDLTALLAEVAAGRPVLVLQNLALRSYPAWHYAVVIGYDHTANSLLLRSGENERLIMPAGKFMRSWELAEHWALVTLAPGQFPARADEGRYLEGVAALETTAGPATAAAFYRAAVDRWPTSTLALFGLGNSYYGQGEGPAAETQYRRLLALDPAHAAARNNLAQVLAERGCRAAALAEVEAGLEVARPGSPVQASLLDLRNQLTDRPPGMPGDRACPPAAPGDAP